MKKRHAGINLAFIIYVLGLLNACVNPPVFSASGTVEAIKRGKDGNTARLKGKNNQYYQAVISRVNLANTTEYQELTIGDQVKVYGDTVRLGEEISIKVIKIKK